MGRVGGPGKFSSWGPRKKIVSTRDFWDFWDMWDMWDFFLYYKILYYIGLVRGAPSIMYYTYYIILILYWYFVLVIPETGWPSGLPQWSPPQMKRGWWVGEKERRRGRTSEGRGVPCRPHSECGTDSSNPTRRLPTTSLRLRRRTPTALHFSGYGLSSSPFFTSLS